MEGFQRILVPLDFSELSEPTLDMAARLLAEEGEAVLVHVVEWLPVVVEGTFGVYPHRKDIEQFKALSKEKLETYIRARPGLRAQARVLEGKPASVILDLAAKLSPDLVAIGSHGRSGLDHLLLGSVTDRVLRRGRFPTLVVRTPDAESE
jgi:nucleotide-binding universal stress UspA family protein